MVAQRVQLQGGPRNSPVMTVVWGIVGMLVQAARAYLIAAQLVWPATAEFRLCPGSASVACARCTPTR
jgi:cbb3-type cytochrome oxidase subunit 1